MAKILITGANGFIGGYLRDHLSKQHQVYAPGRSLLDLTNYHSVNTFFETNEVDVVVHCALIGRNNTNSVDDALAIGNMNMFTNLYRNRHRFGKLINMGTGNEFDTTVNNRDAVEETLYNRMPIASYGYAKNMIARCIADTDNMFNMRLFGVFGRKEAPQRFFKRLKNAEDNFHIFQDCYFDFFWVEDLYPVVDAIINGDIVYRDFNCVYKEKYLMSELAEQFADIHGIDRELIKVDARSLVNFSGNPSKLHSLGLKLQGLEAGLRSYV